MSFKDLKKRSGSNIAKLSQEIENLNKAENSYDDDRIWNVERDKSGNGYAVIRFLPASEGEDVPWVRRFNHGFKNAAGKWFIENCPTSIGEKCPVCEANSALWNSGIESDKKIARDRKRKLSYYANILVIKDPAHPENEGKVFIYRFGQKIFEKIQLKLQPPAEFGDDPVDVFDFWTGANFRLKVRMHEGYVNYDLSEFEAPSALFGGDDVQLEALWNQQYKLVPFVDKSEFLSYADLKRKFDDFLGDTESSGATAEEMDYEKPQTRTTAKTASKPATSSKTNKTSTKKEDAPFDATEGEDELDYLESLLNEE